MLFWKIVILLKKIIPNKICKERRKIRSMFTGIFPSKDTILYCSRRASAFTSLKAGITVEVSMAVPIFFFAAVSLLYLMEIMAVQTSVRAGLQYAGKICVQEAYGSKAVMPFKIKSDVVSAIGPDRLSRSIVAGGSSGIDCSGLSVSPVTGIGELTVRYKVRIPVPFFRLPLLSFEESIRIKTWTGYEKAGFGGEKEGIVYLTETGIVYHKDYHCTHLDLSVRMAGAAEVGNLRNKNGGKYHACERCGGKSSGGVYITDTGDRYHSAVSCSGLKRTVYAVNLSEAAGKRACSKCGR